MLQTIPVGPGHEPFLFALYAGTRREEVAGWGWDAAQQQAFLRMQCDLQRRAYALQYPGADEHLIVHDGEPVGRMLVQRAGTAILLVDIALLPEWRGIGIGAALLRDLQEEATGAGKPLQLHVRKENPARRLYERLGFAVSGENDTHFAMQWRPQP